MRFSALYELCDEDSAEMAASGEYSNTVDIAMPGDRGGEILGVCLTSLEVGDGAIQEGAGTLIFFDQDPNIAVGASAMTAAGVDQLVSIGHATFATTDWVSDAVGAAGFKAVAIPFPKLSTLYAVWFNSGAGVWNSAAGDDEELWVRIGYRLD